MTNNEEIPRRAFLATTSMLGVGSLAGCAGLVETEPVSRNEPPILENRPDAVYYPTHRRHGDGWDGDRRGI